MIVRALEPWEASTTMTSTSAGGPERCSLQHDRYDTLITRSPSCTDTYLRFAFDAFEAAERRLVTLLPLLDHTDFGGRGRLRCRRGVPLSLAVGQFKVCRGGGQAAVVDHDHVGMLRLERPFGRDDGRLISWRLQRVMIWIRLRLVVELVRCGQRGRGLAAAAARRVLLLSPQEDGVVAAAPARHARLRALRRW